MDGTDRLAALEAKIAALTETVATRDARIAELERLLEEVRRSGKRQSAPFSKGKPKEDWETSGRKSGEAHGRHGHRPSPPEPDRFVDAPLPECCPHCGDGLDFERWAEQSQTELPTLRPVVTLFRVGVGRCRGCRRRVQGRHPEQTSDALGAASSQVGPRALGWGVWLHYGLGLSFGKCSQLLGRLGVNVTAGAIASSSASTSTDLEPTHTAIKAHVAGAPAVVMDETGWRIAGRGAWLWVAATDDATVYDVAHDRDFVAATGLVPADYAGTVVRDGWVVYNSYKDASHQTCLAHLLRRAHEMIEDLPAWARGTPRQVRDLLLEALDARDLDERGRAAAVIDIGERVDLLLDRPHPHDANRKLIKHLRHERAALCTFLTTDGVDATNWRGEQGVRPAVVNRKVWGGNRRPGSRDPGPGDDVPAHRPSARRRCRRPSRRPGPGTEPRGRRRAHLALRLNHSLQISGRRRAIYPNSLRRAPVSMHVRASELRGSKAYGSTRVTIKQGRGETGRDAAGGGGPALRTGVV